VWSRRRLVARHSYSGMTRPTRRLRHGTVDGWQLCNFALAALLNCRKWAYFSVTITVRKPRSGRLEVGQCRDDRRSTIRLAPRRESLVPFCVCSDTAVCARCTAGVESTHGWAVVSDYAVSSLQRKGWTSMNTLGLCGCVRYTVVTSCLSSIVAFLLNRLSLLYSIYTI